MFNFDKKTVPAKTCEFADLCTVEFAAGDDGKKNRFSITGYSGEIIENHWWWGNVAFDLEGMKFKSKKTPVFDSHIIGRRVGFSETQEIENKVRFEGPFLSNQIAKELQADMQEGFPMQASLSLDPSIIEEVKDGASVTVNGHTLKGPGAVFRKSEVREVSMCVFGADSNTQSKAFADDGKQLAFELTNTKENIMSEKTEKKVLTATTFAAENPAVFEEITSKAKTKGKAEGVKQTQEDFARFAEKFGDDPAFCIEQFKAGVSLADAVEAENVKLKKANKEFAEKGKDNSSDDLQALNEFSDNASDKTNSDEEATDEDGWKDEFKASKDLKEEFGSADIYVAFKLEEAKGNVTLKK